MFGFVIAKHYCIAKSLIQKLPNFRWSSKVCLKSNNSAVNQISNRCLSTEVGTQRYTIRLADVKPNGRPSLNVKYPQRKVPIRRYNTNIELDAKTNVITDVVLYRNDTKFLFGISIFCVCYMAFWAFCVTYFIYDKNANTKTLTQWDASIVSDIFILLTGPLIFSCCWLYIGRTIKYIILRKGGKYVTVVRHHMLRSESFITVPITEVHCRLAPTTQIPTGLNIKGYRGYFIFDSSAEFLNRSLFFNTIAQAKK